MNDTGWSSGTQAATTRTYGTVRAPLVAQSACRLRVCSYSRGARPPTYPCVKRTMSGCVKRVKPGTTPRTPASGLAGRHCEPTPGTRPTRGMLRPGTRRRAGADAPQAGDLRPRADELGSACAEPGRRPRQAGRWRADLPHEGLLPGAGAMGLIGRRIGHILS